MDKDQSERLGIIEVSVKNIESQIGKCATKSDLAVLNVEFQPVKKIVFGAVGFILVAVLVALIALVIKQ